MAKAIWNGKVIAESEKTIVVEGNHYFPPEAIKSEYFQKNDHHTTCAWKGLASYYDVVVDGKANPSAAWYYPGAQGGRPPDKRPRGFLEGCAGAGLNQP